jgi:AcrR family transcriptional regulator
MGRTTDRNAETRDRILVAAERLFAERGVVSVSNRQIGEAAEQRNTAVVGYHFGTKTGLIRAIAQRHAEALEKVREAVLTPRRDSTDLRDWVICQITPLPRYLGSLAPPTWYARFTAQVVTDPVLRSALGDNVRHAAAFTAVREGLDRCLQHLPDPVRSERRDLASTLLVHASAEFEGALADGTPTGTRTWDDMAAGLVDAVLGIYQAPVSRWTR